MLVYTKIPGLTRMRKNLSLLFRLKKRRAKQNFNLITDKLNSTYFKKFLLRVQRSPRFTVDYSFADSNALLTKHMLQNSKIYRRVAETKLHTVNEVIRFIVYKTFFLRLRKYIVSGLKRVYVAPRVISPIFVCTASSAVSAQFVTKYVVTRLKNRFPINPLMKMLLRQMTRFLTKAQIVGFKIVCSGRFARRGRASYIWHQRGKVATSNINLKVEYSLRLVTLTNSICGIKV